MEKWQNTSFFSWYLIFACNGRSFKIKTPLAIRILWWRIHNTIPGNYLPTDGKIIANFFWIRRQNIPLWLQQCQYDRHIKDLCRVKHAEEVRRWTALEICQLLPIMLEKKLFVCVIRALPAHTKMCFLLEFCESTYFASIESIFIRWRNGKSNSACFVQMYLFIMWRQYRPYEY